MTTSPLPLQGLKVLDLSRALAGPFCATILADLGADVIKIEPTPNGEMVRGWGPFQDDISVYYLSIHRNKRSLAVDFRDPLGLQLIRELSETADILIENFRPGVMEEMEMGYESLSQKNPRLIFTSISGFGSTGPYGGWPGMDQIVQGLSGLMSLTGHSETGPTRVGIPIGDFVAGMWAAMGTQAAVIRRHQSGRGQKVETSLLAGLIGLLGVQGQRQLSLGQTPGMVGNDHPVIYPYGMFEASDGPFNMAVGTDQMWKKLCSLLAIEDWSNHPEFCDNAGRSMRRELVKSRLNEVFGTRSRSYWTEELVQLGIPAGSILSLDQVFADPHVLATGIVETVNHPTLGKLPLVANPIRMDGVTGRSVRSAPPLLGEHSHSILTEFGIPEDRIQHLINHKTISCT